MIQVGHVVSIVALATRAALEFATDGQVLVEKTVQTLTGEVRISVGVKVETRKRGEAVWRSKRFVGAAEGEES